MPVLQGETKYLEYQFFEHYKEEAEKNCSERFRERVNTKQKLS